MFSGHAADYAAWRPRYPQALFEWLAAVAPARRVAWDCATGNGQAAHGLVNEFARVIATDASPDQLANADPHPRIEYRHATAEQSGLRDGAVDVVTVAQALHWFDIPAFFTEVERVLAPGGVVAAWSYALARVSPKMDAIVETFYNRTVGPYWSPRRRLVDTGYATVAIPDAFEEMEPPNLEMEATWTLERFTAYLRTWSAVQSFIAEHGRDPVEQLQYELRPYWGEPHVTRRVRWPLAIRAARRRA